MKKMMFAALAALSLNSYASDYPAVCAEMEKLTLEMMELVPEMKEGFNKEEFDAEAKKGREEFAAMNAEDKKQMEEICKQGVDVLKQSLEMLKGQKK